MTRILWLASLVLAAAAQAGPSSAQAEMFFRNGKRLLKLGKVGEACAAFDASEKLDPTISTRLNQANCREKNNQFATAWGLFLDAERDTRSATDDAGKQLHQIAVEHADKLEGRLSTLEIRVSAEARVEGLEILRDGEPVDPMAWNQSLPIDGGVYKIVARAKGMPEWTTTIAITNEKDSKTVEIPKRQQVAKKVEPVKPAPAAPAKSAAPDNWYCTQSNYSKIGACKPQVEQCEAFRDKMLAHVHDLPSCSAAATATCFSVGGDPHCAPTSEICDAMRDAATRAGTAAVGSCDKVASKSAPKQVAKAPAKATGKTEDVDFDEPTGSTGPGWSCTASKRSPVGTCKATADQCEAFRAKMLERFQDLSECHPVAKAQCFDVGKEPHCAPSAEICDALRQAAKVSGTCTARDFK